MKLASGFCIPEPLPVHTGIKGRQVHPLIRFLLRSQVDEKRFSFGTQRRQSLWFHSPPYPFFPPCLLLLSRLTSSIEETLSARLSKLENYGFDQLVFQRDWYHLLNEKSGSWEPVCPDGTFAAGYTRGAWEKWQIVCLAALSVEDAEDIYLFGTMITGILLIGLGFALGYRKIRKTGTAVQSLTRLPVLIEAVGRAVSNETETINRNMDAIMMKLAALQVKLDDFRDQNGQRQWAVEVCSCSPQESQQFNLIFSGSPYRRLGQGRLDNYPERAMQWDSLAPFPDYRHYSPPPFNCLCNAL